jgi:hypothetical protein
MHGGKAAASFSLNSIPLYVEARGIRLVAPNPNTCRRRQSLWRRLGVLKSETRWRSLGRRLTWRGCRGQARGSGRKRGQLNCFSDEEEMWKRRRRKREEVEEGRGGEKKYAEEFSELGETKPQAPLLVLRRNCLIRFFSNYFYDKKMSMMFSMIFQFVHTFFAFVPIKILATAWSLYTATSARI